MNKTIELPTGKIIDLNRFVALIPDNKNENEGYLLLLEGYPQPLEIDYKEIYKEITVLKKHLSLQSPQNANGSWDREEQIRPADEKSLDADVIICAQYQLLAKEYPGRYVVIATTNVKHLSRFAEAKEWQDINF